MTDRLEEIKHQWENKRMTPSDNIAWLITEVERLRASHDTMTVDCQTQGCREKLNHELIDKLETEVERLRGYHKLYLDGSLKEIELTATIAKLRTLVDDLTDPDDCQYDHHGYCQAHGWMETDPSCPHKRAKTLATEAPQ